MRNPNVEEGKDVKAVIMAGGQGTRLLPLTSDIPKPMIPVANQPIMAYIIRLLEKQGFTDIVATVNYLKTVIQGYFLSGRSSGVKLTYSAEQEPLGTAGSVKLAEAHLRGGRFVVISGDALTDFDLHQAIAFHLERRALVTLILKKVADPTQYGIAITDRDGRIIRFQEKPQKHQVFSNTANTGIYVLEPDIFDYIPSGRPFDFSRDLFPLLLEKGERIYGYVASGYWCDIGTFGEYLRAQGDVLRGRVSVDLPPSSKEGFWLQDKAIIGKSVTIKGPVMIGRKVEIGDGVKVTGPAVIGDGSVIERGASIDGSVIWKNVRVGANSRLVHTIAGDHSFIGEQSVLMPGSVIGTGSRIGAGAIIRPGVKIWPSKFVVAGSQVSQNLA